MRIVAKLLKWLVVLVVVAVVALAAWLAVAPPDLIRVASSYAAKIVCSNVFIAGRDPGNVLQVDVQAPGHPLLRLMDIDIDRVAGTVDAGLFGTFGEMTAVARPGTGCAAVPHGDLIAARNAAATPLVNAWIGDREWPEGDSVGNAVDPAVAAILDDPRMTGPGMRAVVVAHEGRIVGERYGDDFSALTPLLGWSMTKTVTAAIIGTLVGEGRLALDQDQLLEQWAGDERSSITVADLLAMSSGLAFNEDYGDVSDATRMFYLEPDMAAFAADKELVAEPGERYSYSSGTSVILSRIWQDAFASEADARAWPREALFGPLGMDSAVFETDASGTFVGSSYLYANARDWTRFGLFLLQEGRWEGEQILPEGFVGWMTEPAPAAGGTYGRGHVRLRGPSNGAEPEENAAAEYDLPEDAFWLNGHDGQSMTVIPSHDLVVLRMGLTPSGLGYQPQAMVKALVDALE